MIYLPGENIILRPITLDDADTVVGWRNSTEARKWFFSSSVTTPDSHAAFIANRKPHDLVWIAEARNCVPVGQSALTVNVENRTAEFGRFYIDRKYRPKGYALRVEYLTMWAAFEWLNLDGLWLEVRRGNEAPIAIHRLIGWTDNGGTAEVRRMEYSRAQWQTGRQDYKDRCNVELPEWQL